MERPQNEQNLEKPPVTREIPLSQPARIADGLLGLIHDYAKDEDTTDGDVFCARIREYRSKLSEPHSVTEDLATECIAECTAHFRRIQAIGHCREAEFAELIDLLKEALSHGSNDSEAFHERIFDSSDRFKRLSQLEDIREIKAQIVQLVRELRQTVLEKQRSDEVKREGLSRRIEMLEDKLESARRQAMMDPLTRVANRGGFDQTLKSWIGEKKPFVLGMIDLDHFKAINDTHGHRVGDSVLICASQWITERIRGKDLLARYGGDEFAVLLDGVNLTSAQQRIAAMLSELSDRSYVYSLGNEKRTVKFTLSCGLSEYSNGDTQASLIERADQALYEAKKKRNQVAAKKRTILAGIFK